MEDEATLLFSRNCYPNNGAKAAKIFGFSSVHSFHLFNCI
ncbi:hypothetical protein EV05_0652 [Prochlorococcus sp. MIT 0601]|nr:hypothetical protein EV05_0652 [Prochlorococcus sp. MIT 0601]